MLSTLTEKILSGVLGFLLVCGAGLAIYAGFEHNAAQRAQITQLQTDNALEKANTTAALQAASSLGAALDAKQAVQNTAKQTHTVTVKNLASAVAASPAVASTVVPETYWSAIYGDSK